MPPFWTSFRATATIDDASGLILLVAFMFFRMTAPCFAQNTTDTSTKVTIVVRFLNGKTGKPITNDTPNVWFDDSPLPTNHHTDGNGEVVLSMPSPLPLAIRALPNRYADCRSKSDSVDGMTVKYSLEEIRRHGLAGDNLCGKLQVSLTPGVLELYVRPRTSLEKWRL